jgi:ribonuclease HI
MYFDGSKRIQGAGARVVLISPQGNKLKYVLRMSFPQASNNEAEYEELLHGIKMAKACGATRLKNIWRLESRRPTGDEQVRRHQ